MAAASSHTHKYSNVSNQDSEVSQEPIYQNQAELRKQLQMLDKREPIYQNLPAHEKLMLLQEKKLQDQVAKLQLPNPTEIDDPNEDASSTSTTKVRFISYLKCSNWR